MEFGILGPLEARGPGGPIVLPAAKQRALLAILLLRRNEVVSADALVDELWGERAPATAVKSLQVHLSKLRRALGEEQPIETRATGYVLELPRGRLDLDRFEQLAAEGRDALGAGDAGRAARLLHEALALWRGAALADVALEGSGALEASRLEETRLAALEDRIDADLALGRGEQLVPELEALAVRLPLRERLHGQLMRALYAAGRQADALAAFRRARETLVDGLGLEPGPELRRAGAVDPGPGARAAGAPPPRPREPRRCRPPRPR